MSFRGLATFALLTAGVAGARAPIEIPFDFRVKQPIVQVSVNGSAPLPFVIDTGASVNVVDAGLIDSVMKGASVTARGPISGGGQGTVSSQNVTGLTFAIGSTSWTDQRAVAVPLGYPKTKHYAGLLGAPILTKYVVQFDFAKSVMRLIEPASYRPPERSVTLPLELPENLPIVHVTLDAGGGALDARLMLDTGASHFVDLNRPFVDEHRLLDQMPDAAAANRQAGIGTPAPFLIGKARVVFGGLAFEAARVGLSRATSGSSSRNDKDGIVGNDLLRNFIVTIDYAKRVLVLQRVGA